MWSGGAYVLQKRKTTLQGKAVWGCWFLVVGRCFLHLFNPFVLARVPFCHFLFVNLAVIRVSVWNFTTRNVEKIVHRSNMTTATFCTVSEKIKFHGFLLLCLCASTTNTVLMKPYSIVYVNKIRVLRWITFTQ